MRSKILTSLGICLTISCQTTNVAKTALVPKEKAVVARFENVREQCQTWLADANRILKTILDHQGPRNESNTLQALNELTIRVENAGALAGLMSNVHPLSKVRDDAELCEQEVSRFTTDLSLNKALYQAIAAVDPTNLDAQAKRLLNKTIMDFKRSGVNKDEQTRTRIKALQEELVKITQEFSRNIRDDVRFIEINNEGGLNGLPADYIAGHKPNAEGKIKITTDYPDYIPFMTYAHNTNSRRELALKFLNRAYPKNEPVLKSMIQKRDELAKLLGYDSYASFIVEDKMIKNPKRISDFIEQISTISKPVAAKEYDVLLSQKQKLDPAAKTVFGYERAYLEEKYKTSKYAFDSQQVRPYFKFENVRDGLLQLSSDLFGITFERVQNIIAWHSSVQIYNVYDNKELMGRIYLDLHPRENKYKHAAQFNLKSGVVGTQIPEGALVCNFSDPATSAGPALMDHDQVVTFFHEFGHLLHHVLGGQQKWARFSGVATEWDFVETPSQLFEEWAWDPQVLQRFAKHIKTGEPIPSELVRKMRAADEFGKGLDARQQMFYAAMSLDYYSMSPQSFEPTQLMKTLQAKYSPFPYLDGTHFNMNFGHLEGYSAMYYTYAWSKVMAKAMLVPFKEKGMLNRQEAMHYRKTILSPGGSKDAEELVTDFLGHPYSFDAFRDWLLSNNHAS